MQPRRSHSWTLRGLMVPELVLSGLLLSGLLLGGAGCATAPGGTSADGAAVAPRAATFDLYLWEVAHADPERGGGYLFGTVHLGDGSGYDPAILAALADTDTLVLELSPEETSPERAAGALLRNGRLPPGQTLADFLPAETFAALEAHYAGREVEWLGLQHMKPWVTLFGLIAEAFAERGLTSEGGAEAFLQAAAGERPVLGLETLEEQIAVFDRLPVATQAAAIADVLAQDSVGSGEPGEPDFVDEMLRAWREGDDEALAELSFRGIDEPGMEAFYAAVYFERNERMSERIDALMQGPQRTFVGVGAAHMIGDQGLPTLLSERGWQLRRLKSSPPASLDAP